MDWFDLAQVIETDEVNVYDNVVLRFINSRDYLA